jgi:cytoskeletal protein RodZ
MFPRTMRALLLGSVGLLLLFGWAVSAQQQPQDSGQQPTQDSKKKKKDAKAGTAPAKNTTAPAKTNTTTQPVAAANKPKPLFGGSLNLKSSRQSKDATTLGFNGLDPNGQVAKSVLQANPTPQDTAQAQQIAANQVNPAQLDSFIKSGNLNESAPSKDAPKGKK